MIAAATTIGGTSAVVATLVGSALRRRPNRSPGGRAPRALLAPALGLAAAAVALAVGLAAAHWLPQIHGLATSPWPGRLPIDLPVSSAIAATVITSRWRGSRRTRSPQHQLSTRPEGQTS